MIGCGANNNSIWRTYYPDAHTDVMIATDAKTRIVYRKDNIVCGEPSPDALSVFAASTDVSGKAAEYGEIAVRHAQEESGSSIGLRTAAIQALRDSIFRDCEAFMSGAIDKHVYKGYLTNYKNMVASLLAIEQLTTAVVAPNANITTKAPDLEKVAAKGESEDSTTQAENEKERTGGNTNQPVKSPANITNRPLDPESVKYISNAVEKIVRYTMATNVAGEHCHDWMQWSLDNHNAKHPSERALAEELENRLPNKDMRRLCIAYLQSLNNMLKTSDLVEHADFRDPLED